MNQRDIHLYYINPLDKIYAYLHPGKKGYIQRFGQINIKDRVKRDFFLLPLFLSLFSALHKSSLLLFPLTLPIQILLFLSNLLPRLRAKLHQLKTDYKNKI